ncbi:MFS transporter [Brevibacterium oceani]|uniref:MFS transporter n=1 Tax=Brevibacterium oceani TaxID=358099 RepID=UPI0015E651E8|nr:MFS transporter [Brevibacterium oceani]
MDLRARINDSRMSGYQWLIVAICTFLNALDGYDVLAISFTSNQVTEEFGLSGTALGLVMSAALVGMAVGALTLGPVADRIGRRRMIIIALIVNGAGLFLSATATDEVQLGIWRIVTGLGIGGILVATTVISSEYASRRRRGLVIGIYAAGYGLGASIGGTVMVGMISAFGWRSVFVLGGALTVFSLILVLLLVPESPTYLYTRRPADAQRRLDAIARRLGCTEAVDLSAIDVEAEATVADEGVPALFNRRNRRVTFVVWASFFIIMFGFYFVNSWTPRLMNEAGLSDSLAMFVTVGLTLGGAIGSVVFGLFTARFSTRSVLMGFAIVAAVLMAIFVFTADWVILALLFGVVVGMSINGCIAGLYVLTPQSYSASLRSTGAGWAIGVGRLGAIIAPTATGALLDAGWSPQMIYVGVGAIILLAALALLGMRGIDVEANRRPAPRGQSMSAVD